MLEQLELLSELSVIDGDLSELLLEHESLPGQIAELEAQRTAIREDVEGRQRALDDSAKERRHLETGLEDLSLKLKDLEGKRLQIKTNEEYAALLLEIEHTRTAISDAEDRILRGLEIAEDGTAALEAARAEADSAERILDERIKSLSVELGRLDDAVAIKKDERLRLTTRIDAITLGRYERLLESKGDAAVCWVSNGACSACRMRLPPQMVIEVKRADTLIECQSCGRILCWRAEGEVG
ncbi:MAG: C4-type zinc ribbon domain-containing protein [Candidatus Eisenbacteria bacterium]